MPGGVPKRALSMRRGPCSRSATSARAAPTRADGGGATRAISASVASGSGTCSSTSMAVAIVELVVGKRQRGGPPRPLYSRSVAGRFCHSALSLASSRSMPYDATVAEALSPLVREARPRRSRHRALTPGAAFAHSSSSAPLEAGSSASAPRDSWSRTCRTCCRWGRPRRRSQLHRFALLGGLLVAGGGPCCRPRLPRSPWAAPPRS